MQTQDSLATPSVKTIITQAIKLCLLTLVLCSTAISVAEEEESTPNTETTKESPSDQETSEEDGEEDNEDSAKPKITLTTDDWLNIKRPSAASEQTKINILLKEVDPREIITLTAEDESFMGLFLEHNTAQPLGAVLILHDEGLHPDNNQLISPLRKNLPDYGWNTMAIAIPDPDTTPLPERKWPLYPADFTLNPPAEEADEDESEESNDEASEDQKSSSNETDTEEQTTDNTETTTKDPDNTEDNQADNEDNNADKKTAQERTMARITAAVEDLQNRGQLNIVLLGQGIGASWAVSYLESSNKQEMFTLVMIDPKLPSTEEDKDYINTRLGEFNDLPILDIVSKQSSLSKQQAKERKNFAARKQLPAFQQLTTRPAGDIASTNHRIAKRVRGWLAQNAPGEEQAIRR